MRHPSSIGTESIKVYPYVSNLLGKKNKLDGFIFIKSNGSTDPTFKKGSTKIPARSRLRRHLDEYIRA